jgi:transposase-like protein
MTRRKRYSAEFKGEALRRANEEGVTDVLVAEELGINASLRLRVNLLLCRFKPSPFPNEKGPHKGSLCSFGSGSVICAVPTVPTRVRLK